MLRQRQTIYRLCAVFCVMVLLLSGNLSNLRITVHADSTFTFDGTNDNQYTNQTTIEFNMVSIDGTNTHVMNLINQCQNVMTKAIFKKAVVSIGANVFENCYSLTTVDFSQATNLKIIENNAFGGCVSLSKSRYLTSANRYVDAATGTMWLPSQLSYFGKGCFQGTQVSAFALDSANTSFTVVDGVVFNKAQNTLIAYPPAKTDNPYVIPSTVSTIYENAFEGAFQGVTDPNVSITIPSTVSTIEDKAFYNSYLTVVTFEDNANISIGSGAFYQDPEKDDFYTHVTENGETKRLWNGISQVFISEDTYNSSVSYISNSDESACFTPYTEVADSVGDHVGCDLYVIPKVTVSGVPLSWAASANLNFYWNNNLNFYTITGLYLDGNIKVPFEAGANSSDSVTVSANGVYTLNINYKNKYGNTASTSLDINVNLVDAEKPADVTYTIVDDVCYLHSFDTESGLDQIKYILNNGDTLVYTDGFTLSPGTNTLTAWAADNVGNSSAEKTYTITIPDINRYITLNITSKQLKKGATFDLAVTFHPSDIVNQDITWTSSDPSVATVSSKGVVTGVRVGYAVITATSVSGYQAKCAVVVTKNPSVTSSVTMYKSNTYKLQVKNRRSDYDITYKSDDKKVAKVNSNGKITAVGLGECTVITTVDTGVRVYRLKTVVTVMRPGVTITSKSKTLKVGQSYKLKSYRNGLSTSIVWSTSNKKVATVNKTTGKVIAQSKGTVKITATCGKYKDTIVLKVK